MSTNGNNKIEIPASIVIRDLAQVVGKSPIDLIKKLMSNGVMATINQSVDFDTAAIVVAEYGLEAVPEVVEEVKVETGEVPLWRRMIAGEDETKLKARPPVVTILGHVDHGKTSLLDAIRQTDVAAGEAGGITQHIGAYQVEKKGRTITFLDTPGHAAFTQMRARGAQGADIVILVVAADDGVMPQTKEAIAHAKAARVPIIVALNKIDKANANPERVKQQLADQELVPDDWGGNTMVVPVSAKQKQGIDDLLEGILLVADSADIRANPQGKVIGTVIEAELVTGAYRDKIGSFEQAHKGTIFLDEIGDMSLRMQALLLRFLETGELRRVGSDSPSTRVDVRIVSATNRDLRAMVNKGQFRDDLLYRIDVTRIEVPPLRERSQDVPALIQHLMAKCGGVFTFSDAAMRLLESYRWPGNVRELQNVVEQLASLVSGRPVEPSDLPRNIVASHRDFKHAIQDRRRSIAADLYDGLTSGGMRFWDDVHPLFISRDITRADLRQLIRRGLAMSGGSYRGVIELFGMEQGDYKRLLNFLAAHDCRVEAREFKPAVRTADSSSTLPYRHAVAG